MQHDAAGMVRHGAMRVRTQRACVLPRRIHLLNAIACRPAEGLRPWRTGYPYPNLNPNPNLDQAGGGPTVAEVYEKPVFQVKDLPGITDPLGFFDPMGFTEDASEGKVRPRHSLEYSPHPATQPHQSLAPTLTRIPTPSPTKLC